MKWTEDAFKAAGYIGFLTFRQLAAPGATSVVPAEPGVYAVFTRADGEPQFLLESVGGWHKRKDPRESVETLADKRWVAETRLLYVGKAGGPRSNANLQKRIGQLVEHSYRTGQNTSHYGGRYLWQLPDSQALVMAWKLTPGRDPEETESDQLRSFKAEFGRQPFANIRGPRKLG